MTQLSSNTVLYDQIFFRIRDFMLKEKANTFKTLEEKTQAYNSILQDIYNNVGSPMVEFNPIIKGEPPVSAKFNEFSSKIANDINIVSKQVDYLTAKTVSVFNLMMSEIENEKKYLERITSKSKILQTYSKSPSNDLIYNGDSFDNFDYIDVEKINNNFLPLIQDGQMSLAVERNKALRPSKVYINKVDGFIGNNHKIIRSLNQGTGTNFKFAFDGQPNTVNVKSVVDSNPLTYIEFEALNVDKSSAPIALVSENEFCYLPTSATTQQQSSLINWSNYDVTNPLKMSVVMDFDSAKANNITITPYFGSNKLLKVTQVTVTSKNGLTLNILDDPIYIGSSLSPLNLDISKNYFYNKALLRFSEIELIKAEIFFEQDTFEDIEIGHVYWKPNYSDSANENSPFYNIARFNPDSLSKEIYEEIEYDRYATLPVVSKPNQYKTSTFNKTVKVRLKRKSVTYNFYVIEFDTKRAADATAKKVYFYNWSDTDSVLFRYIETLKYEDGSLNVRNFATEVEAAADYQKLVAKIAAAPNQEFNINGQMYKLTNPVIKELTYQDNGYVKVYDVPIISAVETYPAKRMSIGIRDISVNYEIYVNRAEIVSKPFIFDTPVESVSLSVDSNIQNEFSNAVDVFYYISVKDGEWIRISPIQLDASGIAEVIVFNKSISESARLPGVAYLNHPDVPKDIKKLTVKIIMTKDRSSNITPIIYSYQLVAKVVR